MPARAFAEPATALTLSWRAPAGCPQQAEVRDRIRTVTGPAGTNETALQAEGTITQIDSRRYHLKLITRSGNLVGERNLDATSCQNLTGAAAVSIALLLRSAGPLSEGDLAGKQTAGTAAGAAPGSGPTQATGSTPTAAAAAQPAAAAASARKQSAANSSSESAEPESTPSEIWQRPIKPTPRTWRGLAQVPLAALSFGPLPKPSGGVAFAAGASFDDWRLLLGGSAWLRQNVTSEQAPGFGADVDRLTGSFKACRALRRAALELAPCLALSLEHVSARGTGDGVTARSERATWLALGVGAQGRLYLASWLSLVVGIDAQLETARPIISIAGVGNVAQLGPAALTTTAGPEWIF